MIKIKDNIPICHECGSDDIEIKISYSLKHKAIINDELHNDLNNVKCYCNKCHRSSLIVHPDINFYIKIFNDCNNIKDIICRVYLIISTTHLIYDIGVKDKINNIFNKNRENLDISTFIDIFDVLNNFLSSTTTGKRSNILAYFINEARGRNDELQFSQQTYSFGNTMTSTDYFASVTTQSD